jgi:RNA polymerase sigma-70 factor (ECF subfamily)
MDRHAVREARNVRYNLSDEELVSRFCDGNDAAFEILYRRYEKSLLNFINRIVLDANASEEILQEVLLRVVRHRKRYKHRASFKTWLFHITVNLCRDWLRRHKHRDHLSLNASVIDGNGKLELHEVFESNTPLPDEQVEQEELQVLIRYAITTLSVEQRLVVSLKWYEGMKLKEIAELLECPLGTVKSYDHRANQQLRKALERYLM